MTNIIYKTGNMIRGREEFLLHGCNAQGVMGSGAALDIRNEYPEVYEKYRKEHEENGLSLGSVIPVTAQDMDVFEFPSGRLIFNCITQKNYGRDGRRYVNYGAVESCIRTVDLEMSYHHKTEVSMPMIGAGLGGGDWGIISQIIERNSKNFQPVVYDL